MSSQKLSILIVEDDLSYSIELEMLVEEVGYQVAGVVDNSAEALEIIYVKKPDLILMDINIKGRLNGLQLAKEIKPLLIPVLFITSFGGEENYQQAKEANFIGFMIKPIEKYSLRSAIDLAFQNITTNTASNKIITNGFLFKEALFFKTDGIYRKIEIATIRYIEANGNYALIFTDTDKFLSALSLSEIEDLLINHDFMRIHRKFIINLKKISAINGVDNTVLMQGTTLALSRNKKNALMQLIRPSS